jgi:tetratricopeptide (TPR) repeat protein
VSALRTIEQALWGPAAVICLVVGLFAAAGTFLPDEPLVARAVGGAGGATAALVSLVDPEGGAEAQARVEAALAGETPLFGLGPLGLVLLAVQQLVKRRRRFADPAPGAAGETLHLAPLDRKAQRRAEKEAAALARRGRPDEAAELCFVNGLLEEAAGYFLEAEEYVRVAEIRHGQRRFAECAELYRKAGRPETAGRIFADQEDWAAAATAYVEAGNLSVAAEMFEKAGEHRQAGDCYARSEIPRQAAAAYARCGEWRRSAECLEQAIREGLAGVGHGDPQRRAELRKLVLRAGELYQKAGQEERAEAVLALGGCSVPAAEIALRGGRLERAAELFLEGRDAPRGAEVLKRLGRGQEAARVLAEHHRDRGDDLEAARCFEEAGDPLAAGDLYRLLERCDLAGACYERHGDFLQAAEMYRVAGDRERAAACYERAGRFREASEELAQAGQREREPELLARAGDRLRAGELLLERGDADGAIKVLQQVAESQPDFARAAALLGEVFRNRGQHSLAVKKLEQALAGRALDRDTVAAHFALATTCEAAGETGRARELYERILAFDYHHPEAAQRLAALHQEPAAGPAASQGASAGPPSASAARGRYRILGKLGRGGMGIVYKAEDSVLDRVVAFKVLPQALKENPQALKNFLREAKHAAQLNHPNIVTVYDAGEQAGLTYIAMEYVDGSTLKEIVKSRGAIAPGGVVSVLAQMCEGLAYAHEKQIVHRDVKTANTMWTRERKAKIMDFGLARAFEELRKETTMVSGTPYYMSPEQTLGQPVDHRTDIYSLGITVFELLTGELPFRDGNLPYHHVHTPAPDPREKNPRVPELLARVVLRCLQKDPTARYSSTREILAELKAGRIR